MLQSEPRRCHTASSNWPRIMRNQEKVLDVRAHLADRLLIRPPAVFDEIKERRYSWPVALFEDVQAVGKQKFLVAGKLEAEEVREHILEEVDDPVDIA